MAATTTPSGGAGTTPPGTEASTPPGGSAAPAGAARRVAAEPVRSRPSSKFLPLCFYSPAGGKQWVMGVTGGALMGFVLGRAIGSLPLCRSKGEFSLYREALRH